MGRVKEGFGTFLGNAGEHYVVGELLRRNIIADRAPRNAPGIDVLATSGPLSVNVRVKTKSDDADDWVWNASKDGTLFRNLHNERDFTILVHLGKPPISPEFWVVPSSDLDKALKEAQKRWLDTPGKNGRRHDPQNRMHRIGKHDYQVKWLNQFKGRWELLLADLGMK